MTNKKLSKEELLKAIEQIENNPDDRINFLTDIGAIGVGAVGAGAAAFAFGGTAVPILFGLITIPVAAPYRGSCWSSSIRRSSAFWC